MYNKSCVLDYNSSPTPASSHLTRRDAQSYIVTNARLYRNANQNINSDTVAYNCVVTSG